MSARRKTDEQADVQPEATVADVAEAREEMEAAVPGGRYKTADGRWVNAEGQEIDAKGKVKKAGD